MEILFAGIMILGIGIMLTAASYQVLSMMKHKLIFSIKVAVMVFVLGYAGAVSPAIVGIVVLLLAIALVMAWAVHMYERIALNPVFAADADTIISRVEKSPVAKKEWRPVKRPYTEREDKPETPAEKDDLVKVDAVPDKQDPAAEKELEEVKKKTSPRRRPLKAKDEDPLGLKDPSKSKYPAKKKSDKK